MEPALDPHSLAGQLLVLDVNPAGRIVTDMNRGEGRLMRVVLYEVGDLVGQLRFNFCRERFAVEDEGGQGEALGRAEIARRILGSCAPEGESGREVDGSAIRSSPLSAPFSHSY